MGKKVKKWVYQCSICVVGILALVIFDLGWPQVMTFDLQIRIESLFKLRRFAKADFCLGFTTDCVFGADFAVSSVFSEPVFSIIAWMARANKSLCCFANSVDWFFIVWLIFIYFLMIFDHFDNFFFIKDSSMIQFLINSSWIYFPPLVGLFKMSKRCFWAFGWRVKSG